MPSTSPRSSCDSPLDTASARSISSCRRRTCASTSSEPAVSSGSGATVARKPRAGPRHLIGLRPRQALDDDVESAAGSLRHLADRGDRADGPQVAGVRLVVVGRLQREEQQAVAGQRAVDRLDRQQRD